MAEMRVDKMVYAQVESAFYEAMRVYVKGNRVLAEREGKACIDETQSHYNIAYVHESLRPLAERGPQSGYERGQAIAELHNERVGGSYGKARMSGTREQMSKAMAFIVTLPKDYIEGVIPDLTEAEVQYLTDRIEAEGNHQVFARKETMEQSIATKLKHRWASEEREKANEFLQAAKDAMLEEMGIKEEDVLFWAIHWDESFPHVHCAALPTADREYEKTEYSKRKNANGERKVLHRKGEVKKGYSVERFYKRDKQGRTPFFDELHGNIVRRLAEKGFDGSGLINGMTLERNISVGNNDRITRERQEREAMELLALRKYKQKAEQKLAAMELEFAEYQKALQVQLDDLQKDRDCLAVEKEELEIELADARRKVVMLNKIVQKLKKEIRILIQKVNRFVPSIVEHFATLWRKAKSTAEWEELEASARAEAQAQAEEAAKSLKALAAEAEELVVEEKISGIDMATFDRTSQKIGFARKQILKAAESEGQIGLFHQCPELMEVALENWFGRASTEAVLRGMNEHEARMYMRPAERARRALEEVLRGTIERAEEIEVERE